MKIELKSLALVNFKGIKQLNVEFSHTTNIYGENGTGKSTIFDAFTWLLFGKDSHDSKDFNIKTLSPDGQAIPQIDHSVEGVLNINGLDTTLKRVYQEKWTRRRGAEDAELTGHETLFYHNGVPMQAGQYKQIIDGFVDEGLFKLITSATYFNSMKWQDRRAVLIKIAGDIGDAEVLGSLNKSQVKDVTEILNSGKAMADYRKEIAVLKKKLSDDLKLIPARIDEVKRGIPEQQDFDKIKADIYDKQTTLLEIESAITDKVGAYEEQAKQVQAKRSEINKLKASLQQIEFDNRTKNQAAANDATMEINGMKQKGSALVRSLNNYKADLENIQQRKANTESRIAQLRTDWGKISEEVLTFKDGEFVCPTCKRELDPATIATRQEIMTADFEKNKTKRLSDIQNEGKRLSEALSQIETEANTCNGFIETLNQQIQDLSAKVKEAEAVPSEIQVIPLPDSHGQIKAQIEALELSILDTPPLDIDGLKQQKGVIQGEIDNLKRIAQSEEQIKRGNARVKELMAEEKSLAQQVADIERREFAMEAYTRARMDKVERAVNGRFRLVSFRMFNTLINGAIEECCDTLLNGIPYPDVNSAGKIQAGLDIIHTLSEHYDTYCPVFTDNAETINDLPELQSQVVRLYVSKDKQLVIR